MVNLFREAVRRGASDIHITMDLPPVFRIHGSLIRAEQPALSREEIIFLIQQITNEEQRRYLSVEGDLEFSLALAGVGRFRVAIFHHSGFPALAVRVISEMIRTIDDLGYPESLKTLARSLRGLILVTGPSGSGKTTTLAAMIDFINSERCCHIVTLEDPIEYVHQHKKSIVHQRAIPGDSKSFPQALRAVLREDPDVILIGEMRDLETIQTAVTAAETGHLVLASLHTGDAPQTIDRIVDVFSPAQQYQVRVQLAFTLLGIISQQLIPRHNQLGRVAALEILVATPAVRNLIREGKSNQLLSVMQTGRKEGMQSMDTALQELYLQGIISYQDLRSRVSNS
ncbi:Twitching motility protein [Propionispora sp. 2/2-37]|nr:Twitching motility protein [Propionispora sp. 2/2-37]